MTDFTIYHNPHCSKSRQTLALLGEHGVEPKIVEYLQNPPDPETLETILEELGMDRRRQCGPRIMNTEHWGWPG